MNDTPQRMVSPLEAVTVFWLRWTFRGRASRSEYWWAYLMCTIVPAVLGLVSDALVALWALLVLVPGLAVTARRLHDTDRSGWWILIFLIPIVGPIALLIFVMQGSQPTENRFGPVPNTESH